MDFFEFSCFDHILLLGEGNFSFSCSLLKLMKEKFNISNFSNMFATCFQNDLTPIAETNVKFLRSQGAVVLLGIDATKMEEEPIFKSTKFKKIIFNFPHVGGKMKIHLNRSLLCQFFISCTDMLTGDGNILVTLCSGQGGTGFELISRRWDDTWQIVEQAAHGSFILSNVDYFPTSLFNDYQPIGYRGRDQKFSIASSVLHVFQKGELPSRYISTHMINNISQYQPLDCGNDLKVSYAHKLAIQNNPFNNHLSPQYFLGRKLYSFITHYSKNVQVDFNFPYHAKYDREKASCYFKSSLHSLRSNFLEVVPVLEGSFFIEGLVFKKFDSDFNIVGAYCQAVVGGPYKYVSVKDFFDFVVDVFYFDGKITVEEGCDWNVIVECGTAQYRVAYSNHRIGCIIIEVDLLCSFLFKVSAKQLWAPGVIFNKTLYKLELPSLYPLEFTFDISFLCKNDFDEDSFFNLLHQAPHDLITSVKLLSIYQHSNTVEKSYCYRLVYKSFHKPLYRKLVIDIHHNVIRKLIEKTLNVTAH